MASAVFALPFLLRFNGRRQAQDGRRVTPLRKGMDPKLLLLMVVVVLVLVVMVCFRPRR